MNCTNYGVHQSRTNYALKIVQFIYIKQRISTIELVGDKLESTSQSSIGYRDKAKYIVCESPNRFKLYLLCISCLHILFNCITCGIELKQTSSNFMYLPALELINLTCFFISICIFGNWYKIYPTPNITPLQGSNNGYSLIS